MLKEGLIVERSKRVEGVKLVEKQKINYTKGEIKTTSKLNYNLKGNEVIRKVNKVKRTKSLDMNKFYTYKMLQVLHHEGLLPRGYLTRVNNGNISYEASLAMVQKLMKNSSYRIASKQVKEDHFIVVLIEIGKEHSSGRYEVYYVQSDGVEVFLVGYDSHKEALAHVSEIYCKELNVDATFTIRDGFSGDLIE